MKRKRVPCEHGRQSSLCKDCGGASICEHGRRRDLCKDCGGSGVCEHGRRRSQCKECGGGGMCEHGRRRTLQGAAHKAAGVNGAQTSESRPLFTVNVAVCSGQNGKVVVVRACPPEVLSGHLGCVVRACPKKAASHIFCFLC